MIKLVLYDGREGSPTKGQHRRVLHGRAQPAARARAARGVARLEVREPDEAYIVNAPTEVYRYDDPDQDELPPTRPHPLRLGHRGCARSAAAPTTAARAGHRARCARERRTRWFVTGGGGQLATALADLLDGEVFVAREEALDIRDAAAVATAVRAFAPDVVLHTAAYTDVDGAERDEATAYGGQRAGHAQRGRRAARHAHAARLLLHRLRLRRRQGRAVRRERRAPPAERLRPHQARRGARDPGLGARHRGPHRLAVLGDRPQLREDDPGGSPAQRAATGSGEPLRVVDDQVGSPTYAGHLAAAVVEGARAGLAPGIYHMAGGGYCSWCELAREVVELAGLRVEVEPITTAQAGRPAPRPAFSALASERAVPRRPAGRTAWRPSSTSCSARARRGVPRGSTRRSAEHEDRGHRRRRLHRLELRAPRAARRTRPTRSSSSTSSPTPATSTTCATSKPTPATFVHGDICDAAAVAARRGRRRRDRQLRRRDPRRPLHQRPPGLHPHRRARHARAARGGARARRRRATCRSPPTRSTATSLRARHARPTRCVPPAPTRPARPAPTSGARLPAHLRHAGADHPQLQQLRPLAVPREDRAAVRHQRARRPAAAGLRRRPQRARLALRRRQLPRHRPGAARGRATARSTTSAAATRSPTSTSRAPSWPPSAWATS